MGRTYDRFMAEQGTNDRIRHRGITVYPRGHRWRFLWKEENQWVARDSLEAAIIELDRRLNKRDRSRLAFQIEGLTVAQLLDEW